ncbi:hypothetical protein ACFQ1E_15595 [Sphingomonas canadensis]|uniref:DUF1570 domain-containing protein n=1 Tax=Sphingomonas canadensis TaxID=1219257 RepID=A0ABW3H9B9_9SPHN|nr:hypothetical protein [Sphingomonas canadensis]MCW3837373.1 hypothetical protein [Sphingomonas canadensis]
MERRRQDTGKRHIHRHARPNSGKSPLLLAYIARGPVIDSVRQQGGFTDMIRLLVSTLLLLVPGTAQAAWYEATTSHFVFYSDDTPERIAAFAQSLERYDKAMRIFRNIPDDPVAPVDRVTIYVLASTSSLSALGWQGVAGVYMGRAGEPVAYTIKYGDELKGSRVRVDEIYELKPAEVLRHEYAHHFMFSNFRMGALPTWFAEGFAEFHATAIEGADGSITFGQMPGYRAGQFYRPSGCTAKHLVTTSDLRKLPLCRYVDLYSTGWLLTHYLTFQPNGPAQMGAYLQAINSGKTPAEASAVFGDLDALNKTLSKYLNGSKLPAYVVPAEQIKIAAPVVRPLTPAEAATIPVRIRSKAGVDEKEAPGVYEQAVRAAAPHPNDPFAQVVLAEAAFDAKHYDEAEAAARRALASDAKSGTAMLFIGKAKMAKAVADRSADPLIWREVRKWFSAANHNDPNDPRPLMYFYRSFLAAGQAPTANAIAGLYQALDVSPYDRSSSLLAAYALLSDKKDAQARAALATLAYNPDSPKLRERAGKILDMIEAGQTDAAMAALLPWARDPDYVDPEDKKGKN